MTGLPISNPSLAEMMDRVRRRFSKVHHVLWPHVSRRIETLRREWKRSQEEDKDHRTVEHIDLGCAIKNGHETDRCRADVGQGWDLTICGHDASGDGLVVMIRMMDDDSEPLVIMDFEPIID